MSFILNIDDVCHNVYGLLEPLFLHFSMYFLISSALFNRDVRFPLTPIWAKVYPRHFFICIQIRRSLFLLSNAFYEPICDSIMMWCDDFFFNLSDLRSSFPPRIIINYVLLIMYSWSTYEIWTTNRRYLTFSIIDLRLPKKLVFGVR